MTPHRDIAHPHKHSGWVWQRALHAASAACGFFVVCALAEERADLGLGKVVQPALTTAAQGEALAHYASALALESEALIREALPHYRAVLKADPQNVELAYYVAELTLNYVDRPSALKLLEERIQQQPEQPGTWLNMVRFLSTYFVDDPFEKNRAAEVLTTTVKRFPRSAEVYEAAVQHELKHERRDQAAKLLEQAKSQPVNAADYWLQLGRVAQEVWPLAHPEKREEHRQQVNPYYTKALSLGQGQASALQDVTQYYVVSNQLPLAIPTAEQLVKLQRSPTTLRLLSRLLETGERITEAFRLLEELVKLEPTDVEARRRLLGHYTEQRDYPAALPHAEALVQHGGGRTQDYMNLGLVLLQCREWQKALDLAKRAVTLFPDSAQFQLLTADCYRLQRRIPEALSAYEKTELLARAMQPELLDSSFYSGWADLLQSAKDYENAAKRYQRAISLVPESDPERAATILNNLGYMWLEQGRNLDQAGDFISRAVKLEPDSPVYLDSLGWFHFLKGNYPKALEVLLDVEKRLSKTEDQDAEIFDHLAQTYEKLGDKVKAKDYYAKALKLDPTSAEISQRLKRLLGQ